MLVIVNVFTWPQPAVRFGYEAAPNETGGDLKAKLAAHVGYLALDVQLLAPSGKQIVEGVTLREQGLRPGDEVRLARRTKLPPGAAAGGPADSTLAPSCASLKHFHSGFALNCLEEHPKAPVLLRMLQLNHGMLPNLSPPGGPPGGGSGSDLSALLAGVGGVGGSQPGITNGSSLAAALGAGPQAQLGQTLTGSRAAPGPVLGAGNGAGSSFSGDAGPTAAMLHASGSGGGGGVSALERALMAGTGGVGCGVGSRRPGCGGGAQMQMTTLAEFAGELPQARGGAASAASRRGVAGRRSGDRDAGLVLDDIFDFLVDWDDRPENPQNAAGGSASASASAGETGPRASASQAEGAGRSSAEDADASAPPGADNSDAGSSSSVDAHSRATERTAELEVPSAKRLRRDAAGSTEPTSDSDSNAESTAPSNSVSALNSDSLSSGSGDAGSDGAGSAEAVADEVASE